MEKVCIKLTLDISYEAISNHHQHLSHFSQFATQALLYISELCTTTPNIFKMRVFLPAAVLLLIHFTPFSTGAPLALPVPTAQPSSTFPSVNDGSPPLDTRESTETKPRRKPALGQPEDYAHVDLAAMIDLEIPSEVRKNSSSTASSTSSSTATAMSTSTRLAV